jgi:hypothetical protein
VLLDIQCFEKTTTFTNYESSDNCEVFKTLAGISGTIHQPLHEVTDHTESVATLQRQQRPNSAMPVSFNSIDNSMTLSDIQDLDLRRKTEKLSTPDADKSVSEFCEAIDKENARFASLFAHPILGELGGDSVRGSVEELKQELKEEPV